MQIKIPQDGTESFKVSVHEATINSPVVIFAAGAGGLPERYSTLLNTLAEFDYTVVAPHFERLTSPVPNEEDLALRARRLSLALDAFSKPGTIVVGVGHSIGAATLVALSGAQMWLGPGRRVNSIVPDSRLTRLSLLAAPTDFFQVPGALDAVRIPILAWVGSADNITPPSQTERIAHAMLDRQTVDIRVIEGAGHFSFMDQLPPQATESLPDKHSFLKEYSNEICKFVAA
jgi:predicted dienelactone hydrolase